MGEKVGRSQLPKGVHLLITSFPKVASRATLFMSVPALFSLISEDGRAVCEVLDLSGKGSTGECAVACGSCVSGVRDVEGVHG